MKRLGILGSGISYTQSPAIYKRIASLVGVELCYEVVDILPSELESKIPYLKGNFDGFSVTKPFKSAINDYLDQNLSKYKSVNCVKNEGGKLVGFNTDGLGFIGSLLGQPINGQNVLLLGCGGAAMALSFELAIRGARVAVWARDSKKQSAFIKSVNTCLNQAADTYTNTCLNQAADTYTNTCLNQAADTYTNTCINQAADTYTNTCLNQAADTYTNTCINQAADTFDATKGIAININPINNNAINNIVEYSRGFLPDMVVNCASEDFALPSFVERASIKTLYDLKYAQKESLFLSSIEGAQKMDGKAMLVYQAMYAFEIFYAIKLTNEQRNVIIKEHSFKI